MRIGIIATAVCLSIVGLASAEEVKASMRKPTEIPAGGLGAALTALATEFDFQVLYQTELVSHSRTQGASGTFTPDEALVRLLNGTGLTYRYLDEKTVTILPVAGAGPSGSQPSSSPETGQGRSEGSKKFSEDSFRVAQQTEGASAQTSSLGKNNEQASQKTAVALEEVVVTAQKRAERLQDVPVSMSVLTASDISQRQLVNAEDYLRGIPGVNQASDLYGGAIIIRGIETHPAFQNAYTGATVATYFGETPTTSSAGLLGGSNIDIKLIDVERVEVLRGPQGTSFGDASLGGAVRVIPAAPKLNALEGNVGAGYSSTSGYGGRNYITQGVINIPVVNDMMALRVVGYRFEDSGYYRNIAGSDPAFRSAVVIPNSSQAYAVDVPRVGDSSVSGFRAAALFKPIDDLKFTLSYLSQTSEINGIPVSTAPGYEQTVLQVPPQAAVRGQTDGASDNNIRLVSALLEYNLHWADVVGVYSDITSGAQSLVNYTAYSANIPLTALYDSHHREHIGELRLVTKLEGAWNGLAGLYYDRRSDADNAPYYWAGDPATDPYNPGAVGVIGNQPEVSEIKQRAAYGEVSWKFLPDFTLTGGARAYHYDSNATFESLGFFGNSIYHGTTGASGTSFRGNLSYKVAPDSLIYTAFSQGFRLGRVQAALPEDLCGTPEGIVRGTTDVTIASTGVTSSDRVNNYELGTKLQLLNKRLTVDAAVFHINWNGIPIQTAAPSPPNGCGLGYTANAGSAKSDGVELEAKALLTDALRLEVGGSYTDARLANDAPGLGARAGVQLPGSSKVNANVSLQYGFHILGQPAFIRADSIYVGPFYTTITEGPDSGAGDYVKLDLSGRLVFSNLDLDVFVHNAANRDSYTLRDPFFSGNPYYGYRLQPRTVGINATAHF